MWRWLGWIDPWAGWYLNLKIHTDNDNVSLSLHGRLQFTATIADVTQMQTGAQLELQKHINMRWWVCCHDVSHSGTHNSDGQQLILTILDVRFYVRFYAKIIYEKNEC